MKYRNIQEINNEIDKLTKELIELIGKYNPYDILCNTFIYIRNMVAMNDKNNILSEHDKMNMQFCIEFIYGLISCINKKKYQHNIYNENITYEIMEKSEKLYELKRQAITSITIHKENKTNYQEYILDDFLRLDITGKRYDIFEKKHHKNSLKTIFKYIKEKYAIDEQFLLDGIEHLKTDAIFGLNKAIEKFEKIMNENSIKNTNNITEKLEKEVQDAISEMFELENFDVLKITNWPTNFIDIFSTEVGSKNINIFDTLDFFKIIKIQNIINIKPIIKIDDRYYCIRIPRLLDNFDKILLKQLYKDYGEENKQEIIKSFSQNIENYTQEIFFNIFGNNAIYYQNNFYKKGSNAIENDLLIELNDYLLIVEIKSGNFTPDLAYENIDSHVKTLTNLVSKAGDQISQFENELLEHGAMKIYDSNKKRAKLKTTLDKSKFKDIFKFVITFEGFNEIAARAEKINIINLNKNIIVCSIDDLEVYGDFFQKMPINFLNYIKNRTLATQNTVINLNDELDHLGLYLNYGCYSMTVDDMIKKAKKIGMVFLMIFVLQ